MLGFIQNIGALEIVVLAAVLIPLAWFLGAKAIGRSFGRFKKGYEDGKQEGGGK